MHLNWLMPQGGALRGVLPLSDLSAQAFIEMQVFGQKAWGANVGMYVPYVGATKDVDLGPNKLSVQGDTILGVPGTEGNSIKVNGLNFTSRLKVSDLDGTNAAQTILHKHSTTVEPLIVAARSNSDTAAHGDVVAGQVMFSQYGTGWTASSYKIFASTYISADTTGTVSATSSPGRYTIAVTPDGAIWPVDAWWITQDGKIHAMAAYASPTLDAAVAKGTWTASGTWTLPAHTLGGTVSGGGNQINNVIIGTSTPLAGHFTTLDATGVTSVTDATDASSTTTAALKTAGGLGVAKKTYIGDNIVQATAAKGVNFTANTPVAGMTSQLFNWYEEGTWTPAQGTGVTVVGAFSSSGRYTRIGRQVTVIGQMTGATSIALTFGTLTTNLPFTAVTTNPVGSYSANTSAGGFILSAGGSADLYVCTPYTAANVVIYFSISYFV